MQLTLRPGGRAEPGLVSVRGLDRPGPSRGEGLYMSIKLTDTQLMMLSAAAQRNDRYLVAAANLKIAAAQKSASKLIGAGLVKEVRAKRERLSGGAMRMPGCPMR